MLQIGFFDVLIHYGGEVSHWGKSVLLGRDSWDHWWFVLPAEEGVPVELFIGEPGMAAELGHYATIGRFLA
jgi:hypothetical protein